MLYMVLHGFDRSGVPYLSPLWRPFVRRVALLWNATASETTAAEVDRLALLPRPHDASPRVWATGRVLCASVVADLLAAPIDTRAAAEMYTPERALACLHALQGVPASNKRSAESAVLRTVKGRRTCIIMHDLLVGSLSDHRMVFETALAVVASGLCEARTLVRDDMRNVLTEALDRFAQSSTTPCSWRTQLAYKQGGRPVTRTCYMDTLLDQVDGSSDAETPKRLLDAYMLRVWVRRNHVHLVFDDDGDDSNDRDDVRETLFIIAPLCIHDAALLGYETMLSRLVDAYTGRASGVMAQQLPLVLCDMERTIRAVLVARNAPADSPMVQRFLANTPLESDPEPLVATSRRSVFERNRHGAFTPAPWVHHHQQDDNEDKEVYDDYSYDPAGDSFPPDDGDSGPVPAMDHPEAIHNCNTRGTLVDAKPPSPALTNGATDGNVEGGKDSPPMRRRLPTMRSPKYAWFTVHGRLPVVYAGQDHRASTSRAAQNPRRARPLVSTAKATWSDMQSILGGFDVLAMPRTSPRGGVATAPAAVLLEAAETVAADAPWMSSALVRLLCHHDSHQTYGQIRARGIACPYGYALHMACVWGASRLVAAIVDDMCREGLVPDPFDNNSLSADIAAHTLTVCTGRSLDMYVCLKDTFGWRPTPDWIANAVESAVARHVANIPLRHMPDSVFIAPGPVYTEISRAPRMPDLSKYEDLQLTSSEIERFTDMMSDRWTLAQRLEPEVARALLSVCLCWPTEALEALGIFVFALCTALASTTDTKTLVGTFLARFAAEPPVTRDLACSHSESSFTGRPTGGDHERMFDLWYMSVLDLTYWVDALEVSPSSFVAPLYHSLRWVVSLLGYRLDGACGDNDSESGARHASGTAYRMSRGGGTSRIRHHLDPSSASAALPWWAAPAISSLAHTEGTPQLWAHRCRIPISPQQVERMGICVTSPTDDTMASILEQHQQQQEWILPQDLCARAFRALSVPAPTVTQRMQQRGAIRTLRWLEAHGWIAPLD